MTDAITLIVAEDHPLFRKGLIDALSEDPIFRILGEAADGEVALDLVRRHRPHVALLDVDMPRCSGLAVAEAVRREELGAAVVMLTMYKDPAMLHRALDVGAKGYVLKDSAVNDIVACLHMVVSGRAYISPALSSDLLHRRTPTAGGEMAAIARLSPAEQRVLRLIAQGLTSPEIASRLEISVKTVENHRLHICGKLGLRGPQALLRFALERKAVFE